MKNVMEVRLEKYMVVVELKKGVKVRSHRSRREKSGAVSFIT